MAEFINNHTDRQKFKVMFKREIGASGVYHFGAKKIQIIQQRELLKVRIGGGYIDIDEFVDKYTQGELEKADRNSPMRRLGSPVGKASMMGLGSR